MSIKLTIDDKDKIHLFISGSVGVGKSTLIEAFYEKYKDRVNIFRMKEYIDFDPNGYNKYCQWRNNKISLLDFQLYILDQFEEQTQLPEYQTAKLIVWERHPQEAQLIFSSDLGKEDSEFLDEQINGFLDYHCIPKLDLSKRMWGYTIDTWNLTTKAAAHIIYEFVLNILVREKNDPNLILVFIPKDKIEAQFGRIVKRGREEEIKLYSNIRNLESLNSKYFRFFANYTK